MRVSSRRRRMQDQFCRHRRSAVHHVPESRTSGEPFYSSSKTLIERLRCNHRTLRDDFDSEGSAFVISILVLFVLSVLGMALMLTTDDRKGHRHQPSLGRASVFQCRRRPRVREERAQRLTCSRVPVISLRFFLPAPRSNVTVPDSTHRPLWSSASGARGRAIRRRPSAAATINTSSTTVPRRAGTDCACAFTSDECFERDRRNPRAVRFSTAWRMPLPADLDDDGELPIVEGSDDASGCADPSSATQDYGAPSAAVAASGRHDRVDPHRRRHRSRSHGQLARVPAARCRSDGWRCRCDARPAWASKVTCTPTPRRASDSDRRRNSL